jgi:hypothetical protein
MERTIPTTNSDEIDLYLRTIYSLLRSSAEVQIRSLEEAHSAMRSLLHPLARAHSPDMSAFIYSLLRLPDCIFQAELVVLGQSEYDFARAGFGEVEAWARVSAPARRRRSFHDGAGTLACYVASRTDIDDLLPLLTAFQIEWNKLHLLLTKADLSISANGDEPLDRLAGALQMETDDLERLAQIWGAGFHARLGEIAARKMRLRVRLLSGTLSRYRRATQHWLEHIEHSHPQLRDAPVYFVSSNPHSIANMLSGFALLCQGDLLQFLDRGADPALRAEWAQMQAGQVASSRENFLYYVLKKYQQRMDCPAPLEMQHAHERSVGINRIPSLHSFDAEAQVIHLDRLNPANLDPRLCAAGENLDFLARSDAVILNIDYPLGLAAYNILSEIADRAGEILGVYVLGKAATLNGAIGDVMVPGVVHDEQTSNTYIFSNCFSAEDVAPYLIYGNALDHQKAVTVRGTFLQNYEFMDVFYREGYADIEMEGGPYLSAIYEMSRPRRHPVNEIVNLTDIPFDLGFLHYASDTPLSKGRNLGAGSLSYFGLDSTYASTVAVLRRIFHLERARIGDQE